MSQEFHVIFGSWPVGVWTSRALLESGHTVRAVNRSGKRPDLIPGDVEIVAAESTFGLKPTPIAEGLKRTIEWYRSGR